MSYSSEDVLKEMHNKAIADIDLMVKRKAKGKHILAYIFRYVNMLAASCAVCPKCGKPK